VGDINYFRGLVAFMSGFSIADNFEPRASVSGTKEQSVKVDVKPKQLMSNSIQSNLMNLAVL